MPNHPVVFANGRQVRNALLVFDRAMDGTSLPVSLMREPPKKFPKPTPKVVMARPVTFWLARRLTVRKQYRSPMMREPRSAAPVGISMPISGLNVAAFCSYRKAPMTPLMPPTYMTPGIPRFRFPDFSVMVSPVLPRRSGMLWATARGIKEMRSNMAYAASFPDLPLKLIL